MRLSGEYRNSLTTMAETYHRELREGSSGQAEAARNYLGGRGIDTAVASSYRIGVVTRDFDEHADYAGMLCFPYVTKLGGVVSLKFRQPHGCTETCTHPKYLSPYETRLYNPLAFDEADKLGWVAIAEGEIDAITLDYWCDIPAVGVPGTDTWSHHPEWKELFRGYRRVYVFEDTDPPNRVTGEKPGDRLAKQILKDIDTAVLVKLPRKDVNETWRLDGPRVIKEKIA